MAESAVQSAEESLTYFIRQKDFHLSHVEDSARTLRNKLKALLKDVDGMRGKLIEVANNTKNVIDSFIRNIAEQRGETSAGWMSYQSTFNSGIKDIPAIEDLGKKISDLKRRLDEIILPILPNRSQYGVHNIQGRGEASTSSNQSQIQREKTAPNLKRRLDDEIILPNRSQCGIHNIQPSGEASTSSNQSQIQREKRARIVEETEVVGFEDETRTLVGRLIAGDKQRVVISITGMGGTGKTTLAKKVYDNVDVRKSFDIRRWVNVPQEYYRMGDIILASFAWLLPEEPNKEDVWRYLEHKRYLVVINDIRSREDWDGLVTAFPDSKNGSRVLLTTRNEEVAKYADTQSTPHKLRFLNENESWTLFCKKALLGNPSPACLPNLEELGRRMVAKCGGLPLAITVLGGVLSRKERSVSEWEKVLTMYDWENVLRSRKMYDRENVLKSMEWWLLESEEDAISVILAQSYNDLPDYLKPCFLYFGAFRENSEICVNQLIRMWIAAGFVQRRGEEEMEDVAEDYVEELISRSMIQVSKRKGYGMVRMCRIHDHLRDLAISKAEKEEFLYVYGNKEPTSSIMADRLAITSGDISKCIAPNSSTPHLFSLLDFSYERDLPEKLGLKIQGGAFEFLTVMNLQSEDVNYLPDEIGDLIQLRYLRLETLELENLPSTITRLSNLQTLDIRPSFQMAWLPDDITKMEQIRHLMVNHIGFSNGMQLHHLRNLQTLSTVSAGSWIEDGLEKLTNLRDLGIDEIRGDVHMALSRSISKLVHLRSLSLKTHFKSWIPAFESLSKHKHLYKMTLEGRLKKLPKPHVFPPNLTELLLESSKLERDPMETLEKLPNLRSLYFYSTLPIERAYKGKEMVCSAGGFPLLETLSIDGFYKLEEWIVEEGSMQNLKCLKISCCKRLKMLPDGLRYIITLQELKLEHVSKELKERVRKNEGEDWFKIQHIPSLVVE